MGVAAAFPCQTGLLFYVTIVLTNARVIRDRSLHSPRTVQHPPHDSKSWLREIDTENYHDEGGDNQTSKDLADGHVCDQGCITTLLQN